MTDYEEILLNEARSELSYADQKAALLLAALGIGFSAFLGGIFASSWTPRNASGLGQVLWWSAAAATVLAVLCTSMAVWPRLHNLERVDDVHYWGHVAMFDSPKALGEILDKRVEPDSNRTRSQLWHISKTLDRKYRLIRTAMILTGTGATLFTLSGILILSTRI